MTSTKDLTDEQVVTAHNAVQAIIAKLTEAEDLATEMLKISPAMDEFDPVGAIRDAIDIVVDAGRTLSSEIENRELPDPDATK